MKIDELKHSYSDDIYNKKILILGPFPPPYGGVSVHIQRVIQKLKKQNNKVIFFDTTQRYVSYKRYLLKLFLNIIFVWPDVIYYHTPDGNDQNEINVLFYSKKISGFKIIIVDHDCRYLADRSYPFKQSYNRFLKFIEKVVFIGDVTYISYKNNNIFIPNNFSIESSYLPPDISLRNEEWAKYPQDLKIFIKNHKSVMAMSVYKFITFDGEDLYGFDLALDALREARKHNLNVGLVCAVGKYENSSYFKKIKSMVTQQNLSDHIYFLYGNYQLWPLFFHVNLFIRPARSDSYGISIAEAIECGIPVVASDVCRRHDGAYLFSMDNKEEFLTLVASLVK